MSNTNKMLIDATHPEETRVVVLRGGRVEEFDYESAARKLLRGNIYLAKVTRVEPSLQAAFVDYGGNRHGFLAFNEIHPDYYQIPVADRQALLDEEAEQEAREEAEADARAERLERRQRQQQSPRRRSESGEGMRQSASHDGEPTSHDSHEDNGDENISETGSDAGFDDRASEIGSAIPLESFGSGESLSEDVRDDADDNEGPEVVGGFEGDLDAVENAGAGDSDDDERDHSTPVEVEPAYEADNDADESEDSTGEILAAGASAEGNIEVAPAPTLAPVAIEQTGAEDALEELPSRQRRRPRSYKIQEVIKRRQIILIQVVKEERGNKGAALKTYLSLAGRYTVLMPNTARGGGISRKITNPQDRKRLKAIANELEVPEGMGLIIRTAGAARTKQEIKRDFEYLLRLWESVRDLTLESTAPSLVYEEGNLIKRSIRDLYNKDVEEIIVAGAHAHRDATDFMRMLMPSHAKNVLAHSDPEPLFTKFGIERQLNAMFSPYVTLRSGGYLVINQTEALVAVDVNSGKSTREFSIEETALNTNLEAADEVARQVKLRDLAGLIVIDFIDMEEKRNNRAVERRLKDALRFDRARIQLGHISHFGLMEMSRQRMRTGVLEGSTTQCPHCQGTGIIRSTESVALAVLRGLEDALMTGGRASLVATTTAQVALYLLNSKRPFINDMEARNGISISIQASDKLQGANFTIERGASLAQPLRRPERAAVNMDWGFEGDEADTAVMAAGDAYDDEVMTEAPRESGVRVVPRSDEDGEGADGNGGRSDKRRRRRRGGRRGGADRERGPGGEGGRDEGREARGGDRPPSQDRQDRSNGGTGNGTSAGDRAGPQQGQRHSERFGGDDRKRNPVVAASIDGGETPGGDIELDGDEGDAAGTSVEARTSQGPDDRGGRRRRRGRRGGRRGRGERPGHDSLGEDHTGSERSSPDASFGAVDGNNGAPPGAGERAPVSAFPIHIGEERISDFESATMDYGNASGPRSAQAAKPIAAAGEPKKPDTLAHPVAPAEPAKLEVQANHEAPAAAEPAKPRGRAASHSTEPVIESVVVGPDGAAAAHGDSQPASPKRGWWQRTLGG